MKNWFKDTNKMFNDMLDTDSGKIACLRTVHVVKITLLVYVPLLVLSLALFAIGHQWAMLLLPVLLMSVFPFAKYILIPLSERKKEEFEKLVKSN